MAYLSPQFPMLVATPAVAQNQSGSGNVQIGGDATGNVSNDSISIGTLNIITDNKIRSLSSEQQRSGAREIAEVIERLISGGQLTITESGAQDLMSEIVELARQTPLKRDNISSQQFELPADRGMFLFGGDNRITYRHWSWRGYATLLFNGQEMKVNFGGSIPFNHQGARCEVVLNDIDEQRNVAQLTAICS